MPSGSSRWVELTIETLILAHIDPTQPTHSVGTQTRKLGISRGTSILLQPHGRSGVYLGNASGCRTHILSVYQDVHCVVCPSANAHTAST